MVQSHCWHSTVHTFGSPPSLTFVVDIGQVSGFLRMGINFAIFLGISGNTLGYTLLCSMSWAFCGRDCRTGALTMDYICISSGSYIVTLLDTFGLSTLDSCHGTYNVAHSYMLLVILTSVHPFGSFAINSDFCGFCPLLSIRNGQRCILPSKNCIQGNPVGKYPPP